MPVTYTDRSKQVSESYTALQQATLQLEEVLGQSLGLVDAEWDRVEDETGQASFTLRLREWSGEASAKFSPEELRASLHMRIRLLLLWGELLRVRNERQLRELQGAGTQGE